MPRLSPVSQSALSLAIGLALSTSVSAQYVGVGVGVVPRPYGGWYGGVAPGGYLGIYPGGYNGFWSNGFSMYGPPVPTYAPIPGYFGGSDQRLSNLATPNFSNIQIYNGASIGLGTPGAGGAGPRRRHMYDGLNQPITNQAAFGQATVEVRVPVADAEVFFEGINTRQTGVRRQFASPALPLGATYFYKVSARWKEDGKVTEQSRSVGVRANETVVVDFTPQETEKDKPLLGNGGPDE